MDVYVRAHFHTLYLDMGHKKKHNKKNWLRVQHESPDQWFYFLSNAAKD